MPKEESKNTTDAQARIDALEKENAALKAKLDQQAETDKAVAEKTKLGLSREQAISVIERQKHYDAALTKAKVEWQAEVDAAKKK